MKIKRIKKDRRDWLMRAIQVKERGRAEFVEAPTPELRPGHVLVRPLRVSLCGSDIYNLHHGEANSYPGPPGYSGHEMVGIIEAVDAPGSALQVGDVALTLSHDARQMAEFYLAKAENVLPLPPGKPIEQLLQAQQLGTVIYACKHLTPNVVGKDVAIIGQGSVGLWFDFMMRRLGARKVIGIDIKPHRLMLPPLYGATNTVNNQERDVVQAVAEITGGAMADLVVEAAGEDETINLASELVKVHGDILFFGIPHNAVIPMNYGRLFRKFPRMKCVSGAMSEAGHRSTHQALEWIATGVADAGPMLTHRIPFSQVIEAYEMHRTREEGCVKIVIDMQG
jgi:L-iditol 2-dehydrogenase